jgi:hypothetical protein
VGNSLCLQPNVHSASKGTGLLKNTLSTPNHVPAMYNLAGTRLYVDPDLPSEVQDKVTSCYMLMITACTFSYVKFCYYTYVSFLYFLLLFLGIVRQVLCLQSWGLPCRCRKLLSRVVPHVWRFGQRRTMPPMLYVNQELCPSTLASTSILSLWVLFCVSHSYIVNAWPMCIGKPMMPHFLIPSPFHSWVFPLIPKTWQKCQMQIFV